jgi:hypothetical protein
VPIKLQIRVAYTAPASGLLNQSNHHHHQSIYLSQPESDRRLNPVQTIPKEPKKYIPHKILYLPCKFPPIYIYYTLTLRYIPMISQLSYLFKYKYIYIYIFTHDTTYSIASVTGSSWNKPLAGTSTLIYYKCRCLLMHDPKNT